MNYRWAKGKNFHELAYEYDDGGTVAFYSDSMGLETNLCFGYR